MDSNAPNAMIARWWSHKDSLFKWPENGVYLWRSPFGHPKPRAAADYPSSWDPPYVLCVGGIFGTTPLTIPTFTFLGKEQNAVYLRSPQHRAATTTKLRNVPENNSLEMIAGNRLRQFRAISRKSFLWNCFGHAPVSEWKASSSKLYDNKDSWSLLSSFWKTSNQSPLKLFILQVCSVSDCSC